MKKSFVFTNYSEPPCKFYGFTHIEFEEFGHIFTGIPLVYKRKKFIAYIFTCLR